MDHTILELLCPSYIAATKKESTDSNSHVSPVNQLHNIYQQVVEHCQNRQFVPRVSYGQDESTRLWTCTYVFDWPQHFSVEGTAANKKKARETAARKVWCIQ